MLGRGGPVRGGLTLFTAVTRNRQQSLDTEKNRDAQAWAAQQWLVFDLTHSAAWLGIVSGASAIPIG